MTRSRLAAVVAASVMTMFAGALPASASGQSASGSSSGPSSDPASSIEGTVGSAPTRGKAEIGIVRVVLSEQRVYVYDTRRRLMATLPASTGLDGSTPTGRFKVFSKSRSTFYKADPSQRMRWMTRFAKGTGGDNIGFHSIPYVVTGRSAKRIPTPIGREPSSSGCVRMRTRDAQWIYDNVQMGTRVIVEESMPGGPASAPVA